jgi:hypothetical protein
MTPVAQLKIFPARKNLTTDGHGWTRIFQMRSPWVSTNEIKGDFNHRPEVFSSGFIRVHRWLKKNYN